MKCFYHDDMDGRAAAVTVGRQASSVTRCRTIRQTSRLSRHERQRGRG